jgi:anti-sigma B factor antagonist
VDLSISTRREGVHTIVELGSELDVSTVPRLREQLADLIAYGHHLAVDLHGGDFLDPTGPGGQLGGLKRVHPHDRSSHW